MAQYTYVFNDIYKIISGRYNRYDRYSASRCASESTDSTKLVEKKQPSHITHMIDESVKLG